MTTAAPLRPIRDFGLERFFARYEFTVRHILCASDVEGWRMADLLALADDETAGMWADLRLGYTESPGLPALRAAIASLYETAAADDVLVFAGAEEAILALNAVLLGPGAHAVVTWPAYQSLIDLGRATGAEVSPLELRPETGWAIEPDALRTALRAETAAVVVNVPHNPTGSLPDPPTFDALVAATRDAGARLVVDEVYRWLEFDAADRLPAGVDLDPSAVSIGVMSKSFGLAGLRIGWVATRDRDLLDRLVRFKDYTTICASAPSEILALIALRARDAVLARSRAIVEANLAHLDRFFGAWSGTFDWVRPRAGGVGFPRLLGDVPIDRFADELVEAEGVLIAPGALFDHPGNHFRLGFGREDLPAALAGLERFAERRLRARG